MWIFRPSGTLGRSPSIIWRTRLTPSLAKRGRGPLSAWRRWDGVARATVLGTVFAGLGLVLAVLTWQLPKQTGPQLATTPATGAATGGTATGAATGGTVTGAATTSVAPSSPPAGTAYLDDGDFQPEAGGDRLTQVPRAISGQAAFSAHPIAIKCPSNNTGDDRSEVTYSLLGHYVQFDATVRPYYPPGVDQRSVTYVTATIGVRQTDGTLTTTDAGVQKRATPNAPGALTASVEGAEKLIVRVQCQYPGGTIILTDARLTPA